MANKKTNIVILLIVIAVIAVLLLTPHTAPADKNFMEVRLYDANGNMIGTTETIGSSNWFSVVNGVPGVASFDITINIENIGTQALSCTPNSITPTAFDTAVTKTAKNALVGNSVSWTSARMTASQFEATPTPDVFSASVTCTWSGGSPITKTGSVSLNIQSDASGADFVISLNAGGLGTEYCGDGTCQTGETTTSCPADCTPIPTSVKFRTTDLTYVSGTAIGYTATCGSALTKYGYTTTGCYTGTGTTCPTLTGYTLIMDQTANIPGAPSWGTGKACLYSVNADTTQLIMRWKLTTTLGSCVAGQWGAIYFDSEDLDASKVDPQAASIDTAKEVAC